MSGYPIPLPQLSPETRITVTTGGLYRQVRLTSWRAMLSEICPEKLSVKHDHRIMNADTNLRTEYWWDNRKYAYGGRRNADQERR